MFDNQQKPQLLIFRPFQLLKLEVAQPLFFVLINTPFTRYERITKSSIFAALNHL